MVKKNELLTFLNEVSNQYKLQKEQIDEIKDNLYKYINEDIVTKLREFYYFQEDLLPDFNDYLAFTRNKYMVKENTKQLNN